MALARLLSLAVLSALCLSACSTTSVIERNDILRDSMQFEHDVALRYFRGKVEGAREGALGGFGSGESGGCGCQ